MGAECCHVLARSPRLWFGRASQVSRPASTTRRASSGAAVSPSAISKSSHRGKETHSRSLASSQAFHSFRAGPLSVAQTHPQSVYLTWTSLVSTSSFPKVFLISKPPHCRERVKFVLGSGWGLSEPLFTSGFGRPGPPL